MIRLRPFLNSDSPLLVDVWRRQPPLPRRLSNPTPVLLEQHLFSKPYFDPAGFIVAEEESRLVGFVHAGFAPGTRTGEINRQVGLICMLMVEPRSDAAAIAADLLAAAEVYLHDSGASEIVGGPIGFCSPFYLGLYGGSSLPGVLAGDHTMSLALSQAGFIKGESRAILGRSLGDFRPPVDRQFLQLRRQFKLAPAPEPDPTCWQECCIRSWSQGCQFALMPISGAEPAALFEFWDVEPLSSDWGMRCVGLVDVHFAKEPQADILTCFLAESYRHFQEQGVTTAEIQADDKNILLKQAAERLGFKEVDRGVQYKKLAP